MLPAATREAPNVKIFKSSLTDVDLDVLVNKAHFKI